MKAKTKKPKKTKQTLKKLGTGLSSLLSKDEELASVIKSKIRVIAKDGKNTSKSLTDKISNREIDDIYAAGINAGALGGKLLGAGGGGFMLFYVPLDKQEKVKSILRSKLFVPFRFEYTGSKIIYYSHSND